jgi:hypothetical protein
MRKRTTATESNRARDAINAYSGDLLKKLQKLKRGDELLLFNFVTFVTLLASISGRARSSHRRNRRSPAHSLTFAAKNGVQFASQ